MRDFFISVPSLRAMHVYEETKAPRECFIITLFSFFTVNVEYEPRVSVACERTHILRNETGLHAIYPNIYTIPKQ